MRKKKQLSGGAKMKLSGRKAIMLGVLPDQYATLATAANIELRPLSQFIVYHALVAAERVIDSNAPRSSP